MLYTERPDKVGEIAKKIVGHPQSLELDPASTKYTINYDEKKHFKNIEFTAGRFVGVSVLGMNQKPAFTGSSFFSCNEQFESKMKLLKDYCEGKNNIGEDNKMSSVNDFLQLSWGDVSHKVAQEIAKQYENDACTYIIDMFNDSAIVRFFYFVEGVEKLMRVKYSLDKNQNVVLGDISEVHITYEDVVPEDNIGSEIDMQKVEDGTNSDVPSANMEASTGDQIAAENKPSEIEKCENDDDDCSSAKTSTEEVNDTAAENNHPTETPSAASVEDVQITPEEGVSPQPSFSDQVNESEKEVSVENVNSNSANVEKDTSTSSTSFAESERAELKALKREKKVALVDSYKDSISEEDYNSFSAKIDDFDTENELELELLKAYKRYQDEIAIKPMRAFAFAPKNNAASDNNSLDSFVRKNMRK